MRTILSLEWLPWDVWPERRHARRNAIEYRDVPILASPLEPSEKHVKEALLTLNDACLRPIFLHCLLGKDRTTFIIGLYRVYFQDWTPQAAWAEMLRSGFHRAWRLRGFETYFWHHTQKPDWARKSTICQRRIRGRTWRVKWVADGTLQHDQTSENGRLSLGEGSHLPPEAV